MIPEIGHFALILALLVALIQGILPLIGSQKGIPAWIALARPASLTLLLLIIVAYGCLTEAFIANDFTVLYVAQHSNSQLPLAYRIAAVWGGHEGSLLLWMLMLSLWSAAVAAFSRSLPDDMVARVEAVLGLVASGFLLFILTTSSPFERLLPGAAEGRDLNPLLQDPGLVVHPPMLYMGYVGFSVAFAFAIAALLSGRLDAAWARWSRPWTLAAWIFMTIGISLGSIWAYYELGWGGWWFWDPVENASFMPWLVGTALIHSLAVTDKRGAFKNWTVLLAIGAFSLSLLGTFLVRSGVLTSVHAFASDPKRGIFILMFLATVVGSSLTLYAWRAPRVGLGGAFGAVSRETLLLINNILLLAATATVLLGTLYPLIVDALGLGKLSVGPPYFNAVFSPIFAPLVFLMAVGPIANWKQTSAKEIVKRLGVALVAAIVIGAALPFLAGTWSWPAALGLTLSVWVAIATVLHIRDRLKLGSRPLAFWGMHLAHLGIAVTVVGVVTVKAYENEQDVRMAPGDTVRAGAYVLRFNGASQVPGPNYKAMRGNFELMRDGRVLKVLEPEKRQYFSSAMPMTDAAIDPGITRDIYVSLGDAMEGGDGAWSVRVYYKPFVDWIWFGTLLMALGGGLAMADRRYRMRSAATQAGVSLEAAA
ncbi:heme lyase, CcmF subunit [Georgfuchsia toluolica]|uniref:Heme lyase, CcmF subunit n=1 Tax=Georgfuchsia toluolica TaxID=424218 RepID=A0A916J1T7_9PROT|nr:heme lyase CcmF/NrfE family subunit [Georgfuchsia toluolica]CAG4882417.1 heme lyase, CcmF subunit [Georgfuchsia toluolica]